LEVLDPEQNNEFSDHYLNVPFDLSKVMFICTANVLDTIPPALLDRMETIRLPGYTEQEKIKIARRYLLPRQAKENGLKVEEIHISDTIIGRIAREYTREAGLRNLERTLGSICRKLARRKAEGDDGPFRVTASSLYKMLGPAEFLDDEMEKNLPPGVAMGLAWTPYGGELLHIEATTMPGKGNLILTGKLGDVMKESAQAALSYARSRSEKLGLDKDFAEKRDIHIHVPAGATPKDGPSAGVTLVTALISVLTDTPVCNDVCMTGEVTLRGRIMPVGGIKEKILAAVANNMRLAIIPKQNEKDLADIPSDLRRKIKIRTVEMIDEIWPLACEEIPKKKGKSKKTKAEAKS
jgi:ATP-dependent Lon protease